LKAGGKAERGSEEEGEDLLRERKECDSFVSSFLFLSVSFLFFLNFNKNNKPSNKLLQFQLTLPILLFIILFTPPKAVLVCATHQI